MPELATDRLRHALLDQARVADARAQETESRSPRVARGNAVAARVLRRAASIPEACMTARELDRLEQLDARELRVLAEHIYTRVGNRIFEAPADRRAFFLHGGPLAADTTATAVPGR